MMEAQNLYGRKNTFGYENGVRKSEVELIYVQLRLRGTCWEM
jgi:hypothetical protein